MKRNKNRFPLRKVIRRVPGKLWLVELECGHEMCASSDIYGETHANRQRCVYCPPIENIAKIKK